MKSAGLACVLMTLTAAAPPMVYENDFSTRRSAPLPSGQWYETRYHVGTLFNNYGIPAAPFRTDDWQL